jgi:hypothetical protein
MIVEEQASYFPLVLTSPCGYTLPNTGPTTGQITRPQNKETDELRPAYSANFSCCVSRGVLSHLRGEVGRSREADCPYYEMQMCIKKGVFSLVEST